MASPVWAQAQAPAEPAVSETATVEGASEAPAALGSVVVRARNREERLQDVPVPISVVSGQSLEQEGAVSFTDFASRAASVNYTETNPRQSSVSIRGLGRQGNTEGLEASVGVIVDNVTQGYNAMAWGDWVDLERVEVLRGPQGTLLGKNTTLGVINVITKLPSFKPQKNVELTLGEREAVIVKGSATGPLVDGLVAYRASFFIDKRPGEVTNIFPDGKTWYDKNRFGGRAQFLVTPDNDWTARIILSHQQSSEVTNGALLLDDPTTFLDGSARAGQTYTRRLARVAALNGTTYTPPYGEYRVNMNQQEPLKSRQSGVSAELSRPVGSHVFTSITAFNNLSFDARNDTDQSPFSVTYNYNTDMKYRQFTQEFRLASQAGGKVDYQIGAFFLGSRIASNLKNQFGSDAGAFYASNAQFTSLNASAPGRQLLRDSLDTVYTRNTVRPTTDSLGLFGQLNWHLSERTDLTLGVRQTTERRDNSTTKSLINGGADIGANDATALRYFGVASYAALSAAQQAQITNALAIRNAQVGTLFDNAGTKLSENSTSWLISPSFKLSPNVLLYTSASYGEKSGATVFNSSGGQPVVVKPEQALNFELGAKTTLLANTLLFNVNLFQTDVRDYQQSLQVVDPSTATGFRAELGNVEKVRLRGVEVDTAYTGIRNLTLRATGAYNESIYQSFTNATCNADASATPAATCDRSGRQLPNAPRFSLNLGASHKAPLNATFSLRSTVNTSLRSKQNVNTELSDYGFQGGYGVTDATLSLVRNDGRYEIGLIAKNLFDKKFKNSASPFSSTLATSYRPGDRRFLGIVLRARL